MIYIRVELWPQGNHHRRKLLHEATIENVTGDIDCPARYAGVLSSEGGFNKSAAHLAAGYGIGLPAMFEQKRRPVWKVVAAFFQNLTEAE